MMELSRFGADASARTLDLRFSFNADASPDVFSVIEFNGADEIFNCFSLNIDLASNRSDVDLNALLDTFAVLTVDKRGDEPCYFHGVITEIERRATGFARTLYRVALRPALYRLNYVTDSRIFQGLSVPDIAGKIFQENGIADVEWRLERQHERREYCVCYQESYFDFLRRILSEEGIFFWFEHSASGHKLILSDAPLTMPVLQAAPSISYNAAVGGASRGSWISRFAQIERLRATHRASRDYTFKNPATHQQMQATRYEENGAKGRYEIFQYPGRYKNAEIGKTFNDNALEAHRVEATTADGISNCVHLSSGYIFGLTDHPDDASNTSHRLLKVQHEGRQLTALQEDAPDNAETTYRASFTCQPARLPYRPVNPNPRPRIDGPQIAHVTGPQGEAIYCDEHGRVKVWFPWDRHGVQDESSSCWVRVTQGWAGGTMGSIAIPRVGHEVMVEFLDGDPDQPIITGRTYHATNCAPYSLPENMTKMVMRSQVPGGKGFNEISFDDMPGGEELFIHAEGRKLEMIGRSSLSIQTEGTGGIGAAQVATNQVACAALTFLVGGIVPMAVPAVAMQAHLSEATSELLKKRR